MIAHSTHTHAHTQRNAPAFRRTSHNKEEKSAVRRRPACTSPPTHRPPTILKLRSANFSRSVLFTVRLARTNSSHCARVVHAADKLPRIRIILLRVASVAAAAAGVRLPKNHVDTRIYANYIVYRVAELRQRDCVCKYFESILFASSHPQCTLRFARAAQMCAVIKCVTVA